MVRASFGIYSTHADVDRLVAAVADITAKREFYQAKYTRLDSGDYLHKTFTFDHEQLFSVRRAVDSWLQDQA